MLLYGKVDLQLYIAVIVCVKKKIISVFIISISKMCVDCCTVMAELSRLSHLHMI